MGLSFTEENGETVHPHMGSYGIGLGRLMTAVVEANHDDLGIIWPEKLAPYSFFLMESENLFGLRLSLKHSPRSLVRRSCLTIGTSP